MEEKTCSREVFKPASNGLFKKEKIEVPCSEKVRCKNGQLSRPDREGRTVCKDDARQG